MASCLKNTAATVASVLLLSACIDSQDSTSDEDAGLSANKPQQQTQQATAIQPPAVQTDIVNIDGIELELLDNGGGCQLKDSSQTRYLKPMAPCYFVRQAGSLQSIKNGSTTVIAVVGTPVNKQKCGQEVQGLLINNGSIEISENLGQGSIFCADKGLDGFTFSLF